VKEINSSVGFHTYTAIAMCYPDVLHDVQTVWEQMFENVQLIFAISEDFHKPGKEIMIHYVKVVLKHCRGKFK